MVESGVAAVAIAIAIARARAAQAEQEKGKKGSYARRVGLSSMFLCYGDGCPHATALNTLSHFIFLLHQSR